MDHLEVCFLFQLLKLRKIRKKKSWKRVMNSLFVLQFHDFFALKKLSNCKLVQGKFKTIRIQENAKKFWPDLTNFPSDNWPVKPKTKEMNTKIQILAGLFWTTWLVLDNILKKYLLRISMYNVQIQIFVESNIV